MILWDVNIWVYAFRPGSPYHDAARACIGEDLAGAGAFLFSPRVAASFLRLVTNPKIFAEPSDPAEAWEFIDHLQNHPQARYREADEMTFGIFKHICLTGGQRGNFVPDAFLAALAIRFDCLFTAFDAGYKQYTGLNLRLL